MKLFKQLSASEQARFVRLLKGGVSGSDDMEEYLTEQRFSDGRGAICRGTHGLCPVESVGLCARGDLQLKHGFFAHSSGKVKNAEKTTKANVPCSAKYMQKRV